MWQKQSASRRQNLGQGCPKENRFPFFPISLVVISGLCFQVVHLAVHTRRREHDILAAEVLDIIIEFGCDLTLCDRSLQHGTTVRPLVFAPDWPELNEPTL